MEMPYIIKDGDSIRRLQIFALKIIKTQSSITITDYSIPNHIREHEYRYDNDDMSYFLTRIEKIRYSYQDMPFGNISTLQMIKDIIELLGMHGWEITCHPLNLNNRINVKLLVKLKKANDKHPMNWHGISKDEVLELINLA